MSLRHIVGFVLALCLAQVTSEEVKPAFIEDVRAEQTGLRIVSGWLAQPGQIPWQFSLRMVDGTGAVFSCGGSIIHREWGLSAAHCPASRITLVVRAGVTSLTRPVYIFETNTWYNHPSYNDLLPGVVQPNDISLIKFGRRLSFNELLQPIRIQNAVDAFHNYEDLQLMASGFGAIWTGTGSTENLNWVYLRGVSNTNCFTTFGSIVTANTICARYWNVTSQSTCQGDSGGPLITMKDDQPVLIGVTSFVAGAQHGGCHSGIPAGFIRTGPFHSWFEQVTGIDFENLEFSSSSEEDVPESSESLESSESEEKETPAPPTTEEDKTIEEDKDTEEDNAPEEDEDDDTSESQDKEHGNKKRRRRCRVSVDVKVRVGK